MARKKSPLAKALKSNVASLKRAEELLALIARRKLRITEDFFDLAKALKELRDRKLYVALGHKSFDEMLEERDVLGATQAHKLIKVVEAFPNREEALRVGVEKGFALVSYAAATPVLDIPRLLAQSGLGGKSIDDVSARDIEGMTKKVRSREHARRLPSAAEKKALSAARSVQARLRREGLPGTEVEPSGEVLEARIPLAAALRWLA